MRIKPNPCGRRAAANVASRQSSRRNVGGGRKHQPDDLLGGTPAAASFNVTGDGNANYSITLPSSTTLSSGGDTMTVDTFNHDAGATPTLAGGADTFNVGATLNVGATQAVGTYSGTFDVTVNYN